MTNANTSPRVAVLIPCFNEELTIADVVSEFRAVLPSADVYVFDNNSTDASVARAEGAHACTLIPHPICHLHGAC